jgi:hypothetical protein
MSKAVVGSLIRQLYLEELDVIAGSISPGLWDTKIVNGLMMGERKCFNV